MTVPTDWRAQRYADKSPAWRAGYAAYSPGANPLEWRGAITVNSDFLVGWYAAEFDYDEARDRAREDRQHYPLSPLSAFERNRP